MTDEFDSWLDGDFGADEDQSDDPAPDVSDPAVRRQQLEALVAGGGIRGQLAAELLAAMDDREKADARQALVEQADELTLDGIAALIGEWETTRLDPDASPEEAQALYARVEGLKDALRAQVEADRARDDAAFLRNMEASYRDPKLGWTDEAVATFMAEHRAELVELQASRASSDALNESALWNAYQTSRRQRERAESLAMDMVVERPDHWEREVAAAQAANDSLIDSIVEGVA